MLAPQEMEQMDRILISISSQLLKNPALEKLLQEIKEEIGYDYNMSLRKSIGENYFFHSSSPYKRESHIHCDYLRRGTLDGNSILYFSSFCFSYT